ncbi:MAG: AI-2E family transporter [Oscillospiraceae bacterium]|nr:AI-2E family transporter [Oscillospiraceae bacterium]
MHIERKTLRNIFIGVIACILVYWLLHETERVKTVWTFVKNLFSPFFVGAALAFILNVPTRGIEKWFGFVKNKTLRRTIAVILTFIFIALVLVLVFWLLLPQIIDTIETLIVQLPVFLNRVIENVQGLLNDNPELMEWVQANTDIENLDWSSLIDKAVTFAGDSVTLLLSGLWKTIASLSTGIFNAVVSLVFAIYCLFRKEILARQARRLAYSFLPEKFCDGTVRILRLANATFSNFISGQCLEAFILGCMFAISMLIFDMPYIPLVSVLVAVTALVPIVGAFVGCILGAFFILVNDPLQAVWFVVMFLVLQQIEGNLIYPKVVGKSVGLPGMWVLLAVSVGGELMGVAGMLLMIPLASVLYTLLREITAARLEKRGIDRDKLRDHPPEVRNRLAEKRRKAKEKREFRKKSAEVKQARVEESIPVEAAEDAETEE